MGTLGYGEDPKTQSLEELGESAEVRANEHSGSKSAEHVDEGPNTEPKTEEK